MEKDSPEKEKPVIFGYSNLTLLITDYINYLVDVRKLSYRAISAKCKINSPGYIQKVLENKRSITSDFLKKFTTGFIHNSIEEQYLQALFFYEKSADIKQKGAMVDVMLQLSKKAYTKEIEDQSLFNHWIYGVILELVNIKNIDTKAKIKSKLAKIVDTKTINKAVDFLISKNYLCEDDNKIKLAAPFVVKVLNDRQRHVEIQQNHSFFLNLARFHLIDNLDEREYQGLTIALNKDNLVFIKKMLRENILSIREQFSDDTSADGVYRIQMSAFKVC